MVEGKENVRRALKAVVGRKGQDPRENREGVNVGEWCGGQE